MVKLRWQKDGRDIESGFMQSVNVVQKLSTGPVGEQPTSYAASHECDVVSREVGANDAVIYGRKSKCILCVWLFGMYNITNYNNFKTNIRLQNVLKPLKIIRWLIFYYQLTSFNNNINFCIYGLYFLRLSLLFIYV